MARAVVKETLTTSSFHQAFYSLLLAVKETQTILLFP